MYEKDTIYIVGNAKTTTDNAITFQYNSFYIGFVVATKTGTIIDVSCTATIRTTEEFVKALFLGRSLGRADEELEREIKQRYHGSSQKAILVAYKDGVKKYLEVKERYSF